MGDKGLNRGGTLGQQGEIGSQRQGEAGGTNQNRSQGNLNQRDQQKQKGGVSREPNLEKGQPPRHQVD